MENADETLVDQEVKSSLRCKQCCHQPVMEAWERPAHARSAQLWKSPGDLTGLGMITEKLPVEEQIRVRIALKMMRKAYTNGSRFNQVRIKIQEQAEVDTLMKGVRRTRKDEAEDQRRFFSETEPIKVKTIDEIIKDAKSSFHLARDKQKVEEETKKYGVLRPVCTNLLAEIKEEEKREKEERKRKKLERAQNPDGEKQVKKVEFVVGRLSRPSSARALVSNRQSDQPDKFKRPSTANAMKRMVAPPPVDNESSSDKDRDVFPELDVRHKSSVHRSSSVGFSTKSVLDDERIMKAMRSKELQAKEKEDQLKRRIVERERNTLFKQEQLLLKDRQRAWLVLQATLCYMR